MFFSIFRTIRPKQSLKNLAIFAPLVFSGTLFDPVSFTRVFFGAVLFTLITSAIYIFNDIVDLSRDRQHPIKKFRPIAHGDLPVPAASFIGLASLLAGLYFAFWLNFFFFLTLFSYFLLQLTYTLWLKNLAVVDILIIASGFILRVYAGAFAIEVHMSVWFLLCVISLALFLAAGKRRAELLVLNQASTRTRKSLAFYSPELLEAYLSMFANAAWLSYALFTFYHPQPSTLRLAFLSSLPQTVAGINKWLMLTIPLVIFAIMRYLRIIFEGTKAESPEQVILSDKVLLGAVGLWGIMVVGILYGIS